jgi:diamine N-acetyltransferase
MNDKPMVFLSGERVYLSPVRAEDAPLYARWLNDADTRRSLTMYRPLTLSQEEEWVRGVGKNSGEIALAVRLIADDRLLGNVGLHGFSPVHRSAEFGVFIGPPELRGKGYGAEATALMLGYGFRELNLHRIRLRVYAFNEAGIRAYSRCGFREEGRLREAYWYGDRWHDVVLMGVLAEEYFGGAAR